ncbi:hypothetical protein N7467_008681 [Penicillium canescens]|nr:hypothetical protein N7467_008681 [Penicillium canescens]
MTRAWRLYNPELGLVQLSALHPSPAYNPLVLLNSIYFCFVTFSAISRLVPPPVLPFQFSPTWSPAT